MRARASAALWVAGWPVRVTLLTLIGAYRYTMGKLVGGRCRFYPSCSEYAELAIGRTGALRGSLLTAWRLVRCSPLSIGGIDHPPASRLWMQPVGSGAGTGPGRRAPAGVTA